MPNWCLNTLTVIGEPGAVSSLKKKSGSPESLFSLDKLYPVPSEEEQQSSIESNTSDALLDIVLASTVASGMPTDYAWKVKNWGTKGSSTYEQVLIDQEGSWCIEFATAWSPPLKLIEKVSGDFPTLLFKVEYEEMGMLLNGTATYMEGELIAKSEETSE